MEQEGYMGRRWEGGGEKEVLRGVTYAKSFEKANSNIWLLKIPKIYPYLYKKEFK